jgi:hypothetical protein
MTWHMATHGRGNEGATGEWSGYPACLAQTTEHSLASTVQMLPVDLHTLADSIQLNCRARRGTRTRLFCRKTESGFCTCAI